MNEVKERNDESEFNALLCVTGFQSLAERVCLHTPAGYYIRLCFEDGAAWVELVKGKNEELVELPDTADKTLLEQLHDALLVANGWDA